jgi:hypothetical protein
VEWRQTHSNEDDARNLLGQVSSEMALFSPQRREMTAQMLRKAFRLRHDLGHFLRGLKKFLHDREKVGSCLKKPRGLVGVGTLTQEGRT